MKRAENEITGTDRKEIAMKKEYKVDKEYSLLEIIRYNLRMWWLAGILAVLFAGLLGGYKVATLHPYVDNEVYQDKMQVRASLYVHEYSSGGVIERATNIMKIADSSSAYNEFRKQTGLELSIGEYRNMFETEQTEASDVVTMYITFPHTSGEFSIEGEEDAMAFMNGLVAAVENTSKELIGDTCVTVLDAPYATKEVEKLVSYSISESDYRKAILKAVTAGVLLGIIIEVAVYTIWMLLYKKPKNANEIREMLDTEVMDEIKGATGDVECYKRAALFLKKEKACNKISCITIGERKDDTARKVAMCYANEQKKTLYVDLCDSGESKYSISNYMIGKEDALLAPETLNPWLDAYHRNSKEEEGTDITGTDRFAAFLDEMGKKYEYILVNNRDGALNAEAYQVSGLCDTVFGAVGRRRVNNELLYRVKNTAELNGIHMDGVIVYDI